MAYYSRPMRLIDGKKLPTGDKIVYEKKTTNTQAQDAKARDKDESEYYKSKEEFIKNKDAKGISEQEFGLLVQYYGDKTAAQKAVIEESRKTLKDNIAKQRERNNPPKPRGPQKPPKPVLDDGSDSGKSNSPAGGTSNSSLNSRFIAAKKEKGISESDYKLLLQYFNNNVTAAQNMIINSNKRALDNYIEIQRKRNRDAGGPKPPAVTSPMRMPDGKEDTDLPTVADDEAGMDNNSSFYSNLNFFSTTNYGNLLSFSQSDFKEQLEKKLIEDVKRNPRKYILNPNLISKNLSKDTLEEIEKILDEEKRKIEDIVTGESEDIEGSVNNIVFTGDEQNSDYILFSDFYSHIGDYDNFIEEVVDTSTRKNFKSKKYYEEKYEEYKEKYENTLEYKKKNEDELEGYRSQLEELADKFYDNLPDYLLSHFSWVAQTISMIGMLNWESLAKFAESLGNITISDITDYVFGAGDLNEQWKYVNELTLKARPIESNIRRLFTEINSVKNILKEYKTQMEFYHRCYLMAE